MSRKTSRTSDGPVKTVRRRFEYTGKKDIAHRRYLAVCPINNPTPAEREYKSRYHRHFVERFPDHPRHRWDGCIEIPEHPLHDVWEDMQKAHAAIELDRQKAVDAFRAAWPEHDGYVCIFDTRIRVRSRPDEWPRSECTDPEILKLYSDADALVESFRTNPSSLEKYKANLSAAVAQWEAEHSEEVKRDLDDWCAENAP